MLRRTLLAASTNDQLRRFAETNALAQKQARRFVAGETLDEGLAEAARLVEDGRLVSLDRVGEEVEGREDAERAAKAYREAIDRLPSGGAVGLSIKPTQVGLRVDRGFCLDLLDELASAAGGIGAHVTLDMEDHTTTEDTVWLVEQLQERGRDGVGCAIQAYLHRTPDDLERLMAVGASLRLCKGAYVESEEHALQDRAAVRAAYLTQAQRLLEHGEYPRFATHDDVIISELERTDREDVEFQLLHGVRTPLQAELVERGRNVLVYLPYGTEWYPYFVRRMAERPANLFLFLRALVQG